jgi:hypothetical protein
MTPSGVRMHVPRELLMNDALRIGGHQQERDGQQYCDESTHLASPFL